MRALLAIAAAVVLGTVIGLAAAPAAAQGANWSMDSEYSAGAPSYPYQPPAIPLSPRSPRNRHSSTYAEGLLRGQSAVIEAIGTQNVLNGQARILHAEARAREIRNEVAVAEAFIEEKRLRADAVRDEREADWEWRQKADEHREERQLKIHLSAYRLPGTQLDRETGEISWPDPLLGAEFAREREALEASFLRLAVNGADYARHAAGEVWATIDALADAYRTRFRSSGGDWAERFETVRFLTGLGLEAQFWGAEELAMASGR